MLIDFHPAGGPYSSAYKSRNIAYQAIHQRPGRIHANFLPEECPTTQRVEHSLDVLFVVWQGRNQPPNDLPLSSLPKLTNNGPVLVVRFVEHLPQKRASGWPREPRPEDEKSSHDGLVHGIREKQRLAIALF